MIEVICDRTNFSVEAQRYRFEFTARNTSGVVIDKTDSQVALEVSFIPTIDGRKIRKLNIEGVRVDGQDVDIFCKAAQQSLTLMFSFEDDGFVYSYILDNENGLSTIQPGSYKGQFFQVENFDPDLERFDIPKKITTPLQISSRRKELDAFFQLDQGNYTIPPYLLALNDSKRLIGFGLLDVPETAVPFDGRVSTSEFNLNFDYGPNTQVGMYTSARVGIYLADDRAGILSAYRRSVSRTSSAQSVEIQDWWRDAIYTTWGDQVYAKHIADGRFTSEAGAENYLNGELVDAALEKLSSECIHPKTIVLDEGWSDNLGDWDGDDAKFGGSLSEYIKAKQSENYRVVLYFNPFLVAANAAIASEHPEFLLRTTEGDISRISRSGAEYYLFDWTSPALREHLCEKLAHMLGSEHLNADGLKISGTKFLPGTEDCLSDPTYGTAERYLLAVIRDIHKCVKDADSAAAIYLACLNPLFEQYFDIIRLGNTSEVNHDVHVLRSATGSVLLPDKPIDTDDWAAFQKVIGTTTFIKALAGVPNIFSSIYRGEGRVRFQGAMGGCPVKISPAQYRVISAAWKMYEFSRGLDRKNLNIDYDRMEFSTTHDENGQFVRTYLGGNMLAVYCDGNIYLSSLLDAKAIIDLPEGFEPASILRFDRTGRSEFVKFRKCLGERIIFNVHSARDEALYYQIKGTE